MQNGSAAEIRKQILLMAVGAGALVGVGTYAVTKMLAQGRFHLMAVLLLLLVLLVPMVRAILRLRRKLTPEI